MKNDLSYHNLSMEDATELALYWPTGRPHTSWLATMKNDLSYHNLSVEDATLLALDRPLWRLLAASGATHWIDTSRTMMMMMMMMMMILVVIIFNNSGHCGKVTVYFAFSPVYFLHQKFYFRCFTERKTGASSQSQIWNFWYVCHVLNSVDNVRTYHWMLCLCLCSFAVIAAARHPRLQNRKSTVIIST